MNPETPKKSGDENKGYIPSNPPPTRGPGTHGYQPSPPPPPPPQPTPPPPPPPSQD